MRPKLFNLWSGFVQQVATLSTCNRTQVGCLLLSCDGERLLSFGYNGTWRGGPNQPEGGDYPGTPDWVHAEQNALVKSRPFEPFIAMITHTPCYACAMLLVNSQVTRVYCLQEYRDRSGLLLLDKALVSTYVGLLNNWSVYGGG